MSTSYRSPQICKSLRLVFYILKCCLASETLRRKAFHHLTSIEVLIGNSLYWLCSQLEFHKQG